ncbi:MAG: DUF4157 domain-containing protein [Chloroflexota bacterium]|nr:DUF4157 domain-containing protein [Chloroflexota bacterium]
MRFGRDFSQVRLHTDSQADRSARAFGARAMTMGRDIVFASGEYAPQSRSGRHLLAHELTHVVQQGADGFQRGPVKPVIQHQARPRPGPAGAAR